MNRVELEKELDKVLKQAGVSGYSISDAEVIIFVEDSKVAERLNLMALKAYKIRFVEVGRFDAL